ncbi:MAG: TonB-dependent receptor [Acidobacteriota bacterium]
MLRTISGLVAAIWVATAALAIAGEDEPEGILALLEEERVTSASKVEQRQSEAPASITVIGSEQIEISGARTIGELLRLVPGLDVVNINETYSALSIRGFNDESNTALLVLIDGVKMNLEFTGGGVVDTLPVPLEEIDRIEVIRGPGSAIWGQNAFLGVVNIITKDPKESAGGIVTTRAGTHGSTIATARYAAAWDRAGIRVFGSHDTIDSRLGGAEPGRDSDRGGVTIVADDGDARKFRFDLLADHTDGSVFSTLGEVDAEARQIIARARYEDHGFSVQGYFTRLDLTLGLHFPGVIPDLFPTLGTIEGPFDTYDLEVQYTATIGRHTLVGGVTGRNNRAESEDQVGRVTHERLAGAFVQDIWGIADDWTLTAGARYDENSINESAFSPRLSISFTPTGRTTWRASAGRAFRNPAFIENQADLEALRQVFPDGSISNPALKNESLDSVEVAWSYANEKKLRAGVSLFYDRITDFVSFDVSDGSSPTYARYRNLDTPFRSWGGEIEAAYAATSSVELFGNVATVSISQNDEDPLVDDESPSARATAGTRISIGAFRGSALVRYVGARTFDIQDPAVGILGGLAGQQAFVPVHLDAYVDMSLFASYRFWKDRVEVYASVENALDADIQEFPSMPWDRDGDPSTPPESFGGEPIDRQIAGGVTIRF